jgi:hypothetical protein
MTARKKTQFSPLPQIVEKIEPPQATQTGRKKFEVGVDFYAALRLMLKGKSVTRIEWNNKDIYLAIIGDQLKIRNDDKMFHNLIVHTNDITATDWVIV